MVEWLRDSLGYKKGFVDSSDRIATCFSNTPAHVVRRCRLCSVDRERSLRIIATLYFFKDKGVIEIFR